MRNIVFRTNAGVALGSGHIMRMIALAQALQGAPDAQSIIISSWQM